MIVATKAVFENFEGFKKLHAAPESAQPGPKPDIRCTRAMARSS
jgi:hypothetical protein